MRERLQFFVAGGWVDPLEARVCEVIDPATEGPIARIALGGAADVDRAVAAARRAFPDFAETSREERLALLRRVAAAYARRQDELAETLSREMGAPLSLSRSAQVAAGLRHLAQAIEILEHHPFEELRGGTLVRREPIGVCALITPWNWPLNQILCKVAPALATGCSMVLKPSEVAPLNALLLAEILAEAGVPAGVFNLVNGDGAGVGQALCAHPEVDMVSFTGSTRAGVEVARAAAPGVKRVTQELGGKSPNLVLEDADLSAAVAAGLLACARNSGQSCNAPTRMLVPAVRHAEALAVAKQSAEAIRVGDPFAEGTEIGPVVSALQWERIQALIQRGIDEGAELVAGGPGRPEGLARGYYVRPTVFGNVSNDMAIAREEIFGPVLAILPYRDEEEAICIANDTPYGLAGYVHSADLARARRVAARLRCGQVLLNGARPDFSAPFGGYKQSGNGREWGVHGFEEYLETKAVVGWEPAAGP